MLQSAQIILAETSEFEVLHCLSKIEILNLKLAYLIISLIDSIEIYNREFEFSKCTREYSKGNVFEILKGIVFLILSVYVIFYALCDMLFLIFEVFSK